MSRVLYGSLASPFVRRIRLLLENIDYELREVDVLKPDTRALFAAITPIRKMPVLDDHGQRIFDSHTIQLHLSRTLGLPDLSIDQYNQISVIDAVCDSLVVLLMGKRSDLPVQEDRLMFTLQRERITDSLAWLEETARTGAFDDWHYPTICLICLYDWARFRQLLDFNTYPALQAAVNRFAERPSVVATQPV
ncbi:glutathione S-transferase family protein [Parathalassolituus penaei]|uniref:Glutathione S-transferase family protein n=1 Tax=Parathalassolituus penaei TaxID=2997323 RepID=A0A9X3EEH9_9GAMM|nr:glutathione S-transferase family protein [Parathalassolituus penaei]MCY0965741.1 glutathione S-transferase family protein [Parathalassolituus penaei]